MSEFTVIPLMAKCPMSNGITPKGSNGLVDSSVRGAHKPCCYCGRPMVPYTSTHPTKDHVVPRSKGGREIVMACTKCNSTKGDMMPDEWAEFMRRFPLWWSTPGGEAAARRTFRSTAKDAPKSVPIAYPNDPKAQAGFENVYRDRLYLLRAPRADA